MILNAGPEAWIHDADWSDNVIDSYLGHLPSVMKVGPRHLSIMFTDMTNRPTKVKTLRPSAEAVNILTDV